MKATIDSAYEGVQRNYSNDISVGAGDVIDISLDFDKGVANSPIRLFIRELSVSGQRLSGNNISNNLITGSHNFSYTIKEGSRFSIVISKDDSFYDFLSTVEANVRSYKLTGEGSK